MIGCAAVTLNPRPDLAPSGRGFHIRGDVPLLLCEVFDGATYDEYLGDVFLDVLAAGASVSEECHVETPG